MTKKLSYKPIYVVDAPAGVDTKTITVFDAQRISDHIAWRIAHFFEDKHARSLESFYDFMSKRGILVQEIGGEFVYSPSNAPKYGLSERVICQKASKAHLKTLMDGELPRTYFNGINVVPQSAVGNNRAFYFSPDKWSLMRRNDVINLGYNGQLASTWKVGNGVLTHRLGGLARGYNAGEEPNTKIYTKVSEDLYTRVNNNRARNFNFTTFTSSSLDDYLEKVYEGGGVAICGKPVFFDDFRGGRVKENKITTANTPTPSGYKLQIPQPAKKHLEYSFGREVGAKVAEIEANVITVANIIEAKPQYVPIDIDGLHLPDGLDYFKNKEEVHQHVHNKLPEPLKDKRIVIMLSSSAGFEKMPSEEETLYKFNKVGNPISFRLWLEFDKGVDVAKFGKYMKIMSPDLEVDESIYRANQPIYGQPIFNDQLDPLRNERTSTLAPYAKSVASWAEVEAHLEANKHLFKEHEERIQTRKAEISKRFEITKDDAETPLDLAKYQLVEKLKYLGDKEGMESICGLPNHYAFVKHCVYQYVVNVYREFPFSEALTGAQIISPPPTRLGQEVMFLHAQVREGFVEAIEKERSKPSHLTEYGLQGDTPSSGKYLSELTHALNVAHSDMQRQLENDLVVPSKQNFSSSEAPQIIREKLLTDQQITQEDVQDYLRNYTTVVEIYPNLTALRVENVTGTVVMQSKDKIYIDDEELGNKRVISPDSNKAFVFAPTTTSKVDEWKILAPTEFNGKDAGSVFMFNVVNPAQILDTLNHKPQRNTFASSPKQENMGVSPVEEKRCSLGSIVLEYITMCGTSKKTRELRNAYPQHRK